MAWSSEATDDASSLIISCWRSWSSRRFCSSRSCAPSATSWASGVVTGDAFQARLDEQRPVESVVVGGEHVTDHTHTVHPLVLPVGGGGRVKLGPNADERVGHCLVILA